MKINRIILLPGSMFAQRVTSEGVQKESPRDSLRLDDMRKALVKYLDTPIVIHEEKYEIQENDFLICRQDALEEILVRAEQPEELVKRCIIIGVSRRYALVIANNFGVAAVVDSMAYSQWLIDYPRSEAALYGLTSMSNKFNANISPSPQERGADYQRYIAGPGVDLPGFIAAYIKALGQVHPIRQQ